MSNHIILESFQSKYLKQREENKTNKNISFWSLNDDNEEIWITVVDTKFEPLTKKRPSPKFVG